MKWIKPCDNCGKKMNVNRMIIDLTNDKVFCGQKCMDEWDNKQEGENK